MTYVHPKYGTIPMIYNAPISEEVASCAQKIAVDAMTTHELPRDDTPRLFRFVRAAMGRRPPEEVDRDHPTLDDESICEGIVRAINAAG